MATRKYAKLRASLEALRKDLETAKKNEYRASFREVEKLVGEPLPPSAFKHRPWWSNNNNNNTNSNRPWERSGFRTEAVNMAEQTVVFRMQPRPVRAASTAADQVAFRKRMEKFMHPESKRDATTHQSGMADTPSSPFIGLETGGRHPLRGALKGRLRIVAGTDLTKPADPDWGKNP